MLKRHIDSKERDRTVANSLSDLRSEPIRTQFFYADEWWLSLSVHEW